MDKSIYPVTIAETDDHEAMAVVRRAAKRFEQLNGVAPRIFTGADIKHIEHKSASFVRAWIWDLVPQDVEMVLYYDWDMLPAQALDRPLTYQDVGQFAAVHGSGAAHMGNVFPFIKKTGVYFNAGLFVAHRSTRPVFERLKAFCALDDGIGNQLEQIPFNLLMQLECKVTQLPASWNYMVLRADKTTADARMIHFTGCMPRRWRVIDGMMDLLERAEGQRAAETAGQEQSSSG